MQSVELVLTDPRGMLAVGVDVWMSDGNEQAVSNEYAGAYSDPTSIRWMIARACVTRLTIENGLKIHTPPEGR